MNSTTFESSKFNYFLHKLADTSFNVSIKNEKLILTKAFSQVNSLEERIRGIVHYISSYHGHLNRSDLELIKKIQSKFSIETQSLDQEIQKAVRSYLDQLDSFLTLKPPTKQKRKSLAPVQSISLQMAAAPQSRPEFEANLQLVLEYFPRYRLHNDLSVFDTTYKSMPQDWNFDHMYDALQARFKKYLNTDPDNAQASHLLLLKERILHLMKVPVPIQLGIIIETSLPDTKNEALLLEFINLAKRKIPCLLNRQFFQAQAKNLKLFPEIKLDNFDIYLQKTGDLCVIIPKGQLLKDLGFNSDNLEISKGEHLISSGHTLNVVQDIKSLLINETGKERFFRLIAFKGHGAYPGFPNRLDTTRQGVIAGLSVKEFQESLLSLKEKNMAFMHLLSCYSGGTHSVDIHLPDQTIPCPICVQSSFEIPTYPSDSTPILKKAQKILFPLTSQVSSFDVFPRPLKKIDRQKLAHKINSSSSVSFSGVSTLFLPSNKRDIPKVAYTLVNEEILDVSRAYKENEALGKTERRPKYLRDKNISRKAYLFSDPIVPFTLKVSGILPMILLSRGGNARHVIKEVVDPYQNIEDIAKETFNAFQSVMNIKNKEPASKVFFIAHLKCKYEGKEANLSRVMIKNTMKEREVLFQLEGEEGFRRLIFKYRKSANGYFLEKEDPKVLSLHEAVSAIYLAAAASAPSSKALLQTTAGRQSQEDFIEALDHFFCL
jgi:hypothetical protein